MVFKIPVSPVKEAYGSVPNEGHELFEKFYSIKYLNKIVRSQADLLAGLYNGDRENYAAEIWFRLFKGCQDLKLDPDRKQSSYIGLAKTIISNTVVDLHREASAKKRRNSNRMIHEHRTPCAKGDHELTVDLKDTLSVALASLPEKRCEVFKKRLLEEKPPKQVADEMGITIIAVNNDLKRARKQVQPYIVRDFLHKAA